MRRPRIETKGWKMTDRITVTSRPAALAATIGAALFSVLFTTGCAVNMNPMNWWSGPEEQTPARLAGATLYECEGSKRFAVRYGSAGQSAMVILPDREFRLDPVASASGARYTNGRSTLVIQGDEALLEDGGTPLYAKCRRIAPAAGT